MDYNIYRFRYGYGTERLTTMLHAFVASSSQIKAKSLLEEKIRNDESIPKSHREEISLHLREWMQRDVHFGKKSLVDTGFRADREGIIYYESSFEE